MNTSIPIRKGGNQYTRDTFQQPYGHGIPQQHGHNARDGMNYQPVNSIPSLPLLHHHQTAVLPTPPAGNGPQQSYVQGTSLQPSGVASGLTVNTHALTQHGTPAQPVLSLNNQHTHSQGPTPSSTPPAASNDPKTNAHYQHQTPFHHMSYSNSFPASTPTRMYYPRTVPHNQNARGMQQMAPARQQFLYQSPYMQLPGALITPVPNLPNNAVFGHYPGANDQYINNLFLQQPNATSSQSFPLQGYTATSIRGAPAAGNQRSTNQAPVYASPNVQAPLTAYMPTVNQIAHYTSHQQAQPQQQQQQQQQQPPQAVKTHQKERKNAIKIVDPCTGKEVKVENMEEQQQNDKTSAKSEDPEPINNRVAVEFMSEVGKRALEPSKKELSSATGGAVNGTDKNVSAVSTPAAATPVTTAAAPYIPASSVKPEYGATKSSATASLPTSGVANSLQNVATVNDSISSSNIEAPVVNSVVKSSSSNVAANASQSKQPMDYKRPTREDTSTSTTAAATTATAKPSQSWPESGSQIAAEPKSSVGGGISTAVPASAVKKTAKDGGAVTTPAVSVEPSQSAAPVASPQTVPSLTPSQDGLKAPSVTNTVVLEDSNDSTSCKKTASTAKQGTPLVASNDEADAASTTASAAPSTVKSTSPALPQQTAKHSGSAATPSQSLPSAAQIVAGSGVSGALASAPQSKPDPKATAASVTSQQKPSASALQTSGPVNEKPPFSSKTAVAAASATSSTPTAPAPATDKNAASGVKDDKAANPSPKTKNRSKENAEPNVVDSNAKKAAQSAPPAKHHNTETTGKSAQSAAATAAASSVTASKQTNGDAADSQGGAEGKSKKNKKSAAKKEMINKKGSEKEGSDMDVFTEKPASPPEKSRNAEKVPVAGAQTNNTTANRSSKTNSSQKPIDDKEDTSAVESNKGPVIQQNIPSTRTVPTSDSQKTEPTVIESRPRKYTVEYLKSLRDLPECKKSIKVADNLPGSLYSDSGFPNMMRSQSAYHSVPSNNFMMPAFMNAGRGSMTLPTRKSQQGRPKNERQPPIHVTLSLKEDVPLRSSKDAWKPARLNPDVRNLSSDEKNTQELYKTVTGILNKLTPEKFDPLIDKIKELRIDNAPRLQGVIDLIFDKAIDEPGFCRWYAKMCQVMQNLNVPDNETGKMQTFRILLINKCQQQFERDKAEELDVIKKQEEIDACTDPEKKKELQLLFEDIERRVRRKSVGNCRFIGELFKLQMLTAKIMLRCILKLLGSTDEESLECLCKLLTTIGKDLESKLAGTQKKDLESYFDKMHDLSENKKHKVSSRIRFMLQDVIDLRKNDWVPRREADNPKKIEQINAEHERKEQEIKLMNLNPPQRRGGDDYYNNRNNRDFNKKGTRTGSQNDDEWKTVGKNFKAPNYKVDTNKFNAIGSTNQLQVSDSLGPAGGFKHWGSGVATNKASDKKSVQNSFNQPSMFSMDKSQLSSSNSFRSSLSNKVTPSSSMEKPKPFLNRDAVEAGKISRSGSAQNIHPSSRESSVPRQQAPSRNASQSARPPTTASSGPPMMPADELKRAAVTIYQEYDSNNDLKDSVDTFQERFNPKQVGDAVQDMMAYIIENKPKSAGKCGVLLANLIKRGCVTKKQFLEAGKFFYELADDLIIDCPNMWISLAEISNPLIVQDCLQINDLQTEIPSKPLLDHIKTSNEAPVDKNNILKKHLLGCLKADNSDEIIKWIDENFDNSRNSTALVSILTNMICAIIDDEWQKEGKQADDSLVIEELMKKYRKLFKIYIENKSDLEMQGLVAVHEYASKASYPRGFLQRILELMFDMKLISYDSFIQWKSAETTPGVAMAQLKPLFDYLEDTQQDGGAQ